MNNTRRNKHRLLRKTQNASAAGALDRNFADWLDAVLMDKRWRTIIHQHLTRAELAEIQF